MAKKRFTDSELYDHSWYRRLPPRMKCAWEWLCKRCDFVGFMALDIDRLSFEVGEPVTTEELVKFLPVQLIDDDKIFIPDFVAFQYGDEKGEIAEDNKMLPRILEKLNARGLSLPKIKPAKKKKAVQSSQELNSDPSPLDPPSDPPSMGDASPSHGVKVEEEVKDKVIRDESVREGIEPDSNRPPPPPENQPEKPPDSFGPRELATAWNERMAKVKSWDGARSISLVNLAEFKSKSSRFKAAKARLEERPSRDYWLDVIERISRSPFCRGKGASDGWLANFDFLLRPETHVRVMENQFGCSPPKPKAPTETIRPPEREHEAAKLSDEERARKAEDLRQRMASVFQHSAVPGAPA